MDLGRNWRASRKSGKGGKNDHGLHLLTKFGGSARWKKKKQKRVGETFEELSPEAVGVRCLLSLCSRFVIPLGLDSSVLFPLSAFLERALWTSLLSSKILLLFLSGTTMSLESGGSCSTTSAGSTTWRSKEIEGAGRVKPGSTAMRGEGHDEIDRQAT